METLKVFVADSRADLHVYFARRDESSREKPLGSWLSSHTISLRKAQP